MRLGVAVVALLLEATGCSVLVGSTDGYHMAEAGAVGCSSAADCAGKDICCLSATATVAAMAPAGTCQASCAVPQLCAQSSECGSASSCLAQECDAGEGFTFTLHACGSVCQIASPADD
jgi:hypothetical protein